MVAEWEGFDGVRRKVTAVTTLELIGKVRSEIDASEIEPPKTATEVRAVHAEHDKQLRRLIEETDDSRREALKSYLETYQRQLREKEAEEQKPKPKENPWKRRFI
jgi:uncharacterized protein YdiU (UPF0061 family)